MALTKHDATSPHEVMPRSKEFFDRFFDDHLSMFRRPFLVWPEEGLGVSIEEYIDEGSLVVRAELAGIDPDKDVEITLSNGILHIEAERHKEETVEGRSYVRREFRYGSFARELPLPLGVTENDIKATYKDGILEIRVPMPDTKPATKISVAKS